MGSFATDIYQAKYAHVKTNGTKETWQEIAKRVAYGVFGAIGVQANEIANRVAEMIENRELMPGGRYLYATGRPFHQTNNCFLFRPDDSREGWSSYVRNAMMCLMTGGGVGGWYGEIRASGEPIRKTGGTASGPLSLMEMVNEVGRHVMQGGARRSAIWAGLPWNHADIREFITMKNWPPEVRAMKERDFNYPARMDMTNISVALNDSFFAAIHDPRFENAWASEVYWTVIKRMLKTGEPGFSVDCGADAYENLRNACTEITSPDDSDVCNLVHINMARMKDLVQFRFTVRSATWFALAGTVYSDVPFDEVSHVREKNRRLGVGLMGIHEWLMQRGKPYGPDEELERWLEVYKEETEVVSEYYSKLWGMTRPVKTRAIAPTGTTGIVAETTTGCEPMFCAAYKRRYLSDGNTWKFQFVVDPTARRMVEEYGRKPEDLEDAYSLAENPERRVEFQAFLQQYVDHGISSTINLPAWGTRHNNEGTVESFGRMLLRNLPRLRGITVFPDGARGGQPLTTVPYETAVSNEGDVFEETGDVCQLTKDGASCGD